MKRKSTSPTRAEKRRLPGASKPTIGVGEDAIRGRGDGGRMPALGCGDIGERVDANLIPQGVGDDFDNFESDDPGPDDAGGI